MFALNSFELWCSRTFWCGVFERGVKTFAQSLLAVLTVGVGVAGVDWVSGLSVAAVATLTSVLTSFADPVRTDTGLASASERVS